MFHRTQRLHQTYLKQKNKTNTKIEQIFEIEMSS